MSDALVIEGLVIDRGGREVVHGVDLTAEPGTITALLGPNGAGKSSLVLALAGILKPRAGSVSIGEQSLVGKRPTTIRAAGLATVPEGHRVLKDMTVADNLRTASFLVPRPQRDAAIERVHGLFEELAPLSDRLAGSLSGGQQQMLAIGRALMSAPRLVVFDEISLGLSPIAVDEVYAALAGIRASGVSMIVVEQSVDRALQVADRALVLSQGEITLQGTPTELLKDERLLASYLG